MPSDQTSITTTTVTPPAPPRKRVTRGTELDEDDTSSSLELPATRLAQATERGMTKGSPGWSYEASYAASHGNKGLVNGAAIAADASRAARKRIAVQREFSKRTGMTMYEYNQLQKYKKINEANRKKFVAQARAGKFQDNIYLSNQRWDDLGATVDENGNLTETVDLSEKGANGKIIATLNAWAKAVNDPNAGRYGGRYNTNALPKGIFIQDKDGNWKTNESMITSQAQLNALAQMMKQDDARQGAGKAAQAERQKKADEINRKFILDSGETFFSKADLNQMSSEELKAQADALRQEHIEGASDLEYGNYTPEEREKIIRDNAYTETVDGSRHGSDIRNGNHGTASLQNAVGGRPDSIEEWVAPVPGEPRTGPTDPQPGANGNLRDGDIEELMIEPAEPRENELPAGRDQGSVEETEEDE